MTGIFIKSKLLLHLTASYRRCYGLTPCCHYITTAGLSGSKIDHDGAPTSGSGSIPVSVDIQTASGETVVDDVSVIDDKRDISRMPSEFHDDMLHVMKPPAVPNDYISRLFQSPHELRQLYAKFGKKSGIDPGIMWPSREELDDMIAFEKEFEPTVQQMWQRLNEKRKQELEERKQKVDTVEKHMAKMPQLIEQFRQRLKKAEELERKQAEKRQTLLEEARDYFGYELDPRDPRFIEMQERKEEEEKQMKKKKKKNEKQTRLNAILDGKK